MRSDHPHRCLGGRRCRGLVLLAVIGALGVLPSLAQAAGPPTLGAIWVTDVSAGSATFHGEVNPEGSLTTYCFEYATEAAFGEKGFSGAAKAPAGCTASAGSGSNPVVVSQNVSALKANTTYHYRLTASGEGATTSSPQTFISQEIGSAFKLPDARGWEMVSPADKNGGAIQGFEENHGGGVLQAAATGPGAITYSSASSFGGSEAQGAPQGSQYISRRSAGGWSTQNITMPALSGSYGSEPNGVPYQLFSPDLARGLMLNGVHCRGEGSGCPVANPPLPGTGAPAGYQNYYLRDNEAGSFGALLTESNAELAPLTAGQLDLAFAGSSPDLRHVVLSTCAALTIDAAEVPSGGGGCEPAETNLYEWSGGTLSPINEPASHHAQLAAQAGAISEDGRRVYFTAGEDSPILLREEGEPIKLIANTVGGVGAFQAASADGSLALYTVGGDLFRYDALAETSEALASGVQGVLGASADATSVYYATGAGIFRWHSGGTTPVANVAGAADASDYPPATGTARVSADGNRLLFLSKASLSGYDNTDAGTGQPDSEVFLYGTAANGGAGALTCVSCNPTNERPLGPSTITGAIANGKAPGSTQAYKPRNLSEGASRVFFDSKDALVALDTNKASDAYEWEAQGVGSCAKAGGCLSLVSSGTDGEGASFIDASADGSNAYFLTSASLHEPPNLPHTTITPLGDIDPGSADVYNARVGGGFAEPPTPIPCEGDSCQSLPSPPEDPTVGTLIPGPANPPVHFPKVHKPKKPKHGHKQGHHHKGKHRRGRR